MKRLMREPLVHFLLLGAAVFGAYGLAGGTRTTDPVPILISTGRIESLATAFTRTWQRPPAPAELAGLVREYVREEVCAREAIALGLHEDDPIIRRRLRQKLEFVSEDATMDSAPTDGELSGFLEAHPDRFRVEGRLSFAQVYLDPDRRGAALVSDAAAMLAALNQASAAIDPSTWGDATMLDRESTDVAKSDVLRRFGPAFAAKLGELPIGRWHGPIESGYGAHLVLIRNRSADRLPALDEIRDAVRREYVEAQRRQARESFYEALLQRYAVIIESPGPGLSGPVLAEGRP
ncbi:MAG: peptidyl-prolyl cis-trans isomerase [Phycisphaerae bacterium]|nr:peptidyl-prolyl cis-trans isomerase [Phycisphaerae bacterium]